MAAPAVNMRAAAAKFFTASHFAVAGASSIPSKFGHRIFAWYIQRPLDATPLNPTTPSITVHGEHYDTIPSLSKVPQPQNTSLSVITPPPVTAKLLQQAKEAGIRAVWLQPGSFTNKELEFALVNWPDAAVGGFADGTVGGEGWCILVDGDTAMEEAAALQKQDRHLTSGAAGKAAVGFGSSSSSSSSSRPPKRQVARAHKL